MLHFAARHVGDRRCRGMKRADNTVPAGNAGKNPRAISLGQPNRVLSERAQDRLVDSRALRATLATTPTARRRELVGQAVNVKQRQQIRGRYRDGASCDDCK